MKTATIFSVMAAIAIASQALAQEACVRPTPPSSLDGGSATKEQLLATKSEVIAFMAASDTYQTCMIDSITAMRTEAKESKTKVDKAAIKEADNQVTANQADKVAVGKAYNSAVRAYNAANPS